LAAVPVELWRNVELKAHDPEPAKTLAASFELRAEDRGAIWQQDTYFHAPHGTLKMREEKPGRPHLIHYDRACEPWQRESRYRIAQVADAQAVQAVLAARSGFASK
jgi:adenylate cyclase, class 2